MSEIALHLHSKKRKTNPFGIEPEEHSIRKYLAKFAVDMALEFDAKAIIAPSQSGETARMISAMRARKPIFAPCHDETRVRQLALSHGIRPSRLATYNNTNEMVLGAVKGLLAAGDLMPKDLIVIVAGTPRELKHESNYLEVGIAEDLLKEYN
jgi:pyruvate kinase